MIKKLPIYQAKITDENLGMTTISFVDYPAVESDWLSFDKQKETVKFSVENEEQRIVMGVVMRADYLIYRRTESGYEYYITYSPDTIRLMARKYLKDGFQNNVDLQHDGNLIDGVEMEEMFIKDSENGISPKGFEDISDGSLFARFKVVNDDVWNEIKEGKYNGFSLEGYFEVEEQDPEQQEFNEIMELINKINLNKLYKMSKLNNIKQMLQKILMQFNSVVTDKGTLYFEEDEIAVGVSVMTKDEEGNDKTVEDGDYYLGDEDGRTVVVKNGIVDEIKEKEEEPETEDEPEQQQENSKQVRFNKIKTAFEESYAEKENQIIDAIRKTGNYDCYLIEAGDTYAVVDEWVDETMDYKYFRYEISWGEDGSVIVGEKSEVKPAFVPVETDVEKVAEEVEQEYTKEKFEELQNTIKELNSKIEELENEPAGKPAKEAFKKEKFSTGNPQFDNLLRYCGK